MDTPIANSYVRAGSVLPGDTHKLCSQCKERLPLDEFTRRPSENYAWSPDCKSCQRWRGIKNRLGVSKSEWEDLYRVQDGKCAVCQVNLPDSRPTVKTVTDHCHTTGVIRGITCTRCNVALGMVEAIGADVLQRYLETWQEKFPNGLLPGKGAPAD